MENKQFPELDPMQSMPELTPDAPFAPEIPEEPPVITELTFDSEPQTIPEDPTPQPIPETPAEAAEPELSSEEQPDPLVEEAPAEAPAVAEAAPDESPNAEEFSSDTPAAAEETPVDISVVEEAPADIPAAAEEPSAEISAAEDAPAENPAAEEITAESPAMAEESSAAEADAPIPSDALPSQEVPESTAETDPLDIPSLMHILEDPVPQAAKTPEPEEDALDQEYRDNGKEFDTLFHASAKKEPKKPDVQRPSQKGRPKKKKGEGLFGIPSLVVTVVWLALILVIGTTLGRMLWVSAADVLAFGREDKPVTITIYEADTMDDIVDKLYDAGLIRYKSLFNLYASISDAEEDIKPGIYDLNTRYDYHALVNFMSPRSSREVIKLTIPEGYTSRQIFALLEENRICTAVDLGAYAANGELSDYWFLENVERGSENSLEGYLFPDTYEFYKNSTPREALEKMLDNFDARFTEEMRAQIDAINANITGGGYTVWEITIIASLIEKESAAPAESAQIAGVIYNRLFNWEYPALLNIDAAIVYAQGGDAENIDTSLDSPYNTYTHVGLTPGPISNPGLSSLQAALNPASHNYYYYVLNPATGMHSFSTTQEEHDANIAAFYN